MLLKVRVKDIEVMRRMKKDDCLMFRWLVKDGKFMKLWCLDLWLSMKE